MSDDINITKGSFEVLGGLVVSVLAWLGKRQVSTVEDRVEKLEQWREDGHPAAHQAMEDRLGTKIDDLARTTTNRLDHLLEVVIKK